MMTTPPKFNFLSSFWIWVDRWGSLFLLALTFIKICTFVGGLVVHCTHMHRRHGPSMKLLLTLPPSCVIWSVDTLSALARDAMDKRGEECRATGSRWDKKG
jgi:hypothetical protein